MLQTNFVWSPGVLKIHLLHLNVPKINTRSTLFHAAYVLEKCSSCLPACRKDGWFITAGIPLNTLAYSGHGQAWWLLCRMNSPIHKSSIDFVSALYESTETSTAPLIEIYERISIVFRPMGYLKPPPLPN